MIDSMTIENVKRELRNELTQQSGLREGVDGVGQEIEFKVGVEKRPNGATIVEGIARNAAGQVVGRASRTITQLNG